MSKKIKKIKKRIKTIEKKLKYVYDSLEPKSPTNRSC
jgi:tetrahydromethanopterin S-methyltransferase subunit G